MQLLGSLSIPRCYIPKDFGEPISQTLHCFSDASSTAYGQATYLRSVNEEGEIYVSLVTAKSHVAPLRKSITLPRLELTAADVSVQVSVLVKEELDIPDLNITYWTDSTIVLGYISNPVKRFRTFVANRVSRINEYTDKSQWRHVSSEDNPADLASRGLSPSDNAKVKMWFSSSGFLWKEEEHWPENITPIVDNDDVELKQVPVTVNTVNVSEYSDVITILETNVSTWYKFIRVLAQVIKFIKIIRMLVKRKRSASSSNLVVECKVDNNSSLNCALSLSDIQEAKKKALQLTQTKYLPYETEILNKLAVDECSKSIRKRSSLYKLDPFMNDGLIFVGGRLKNSQEDSVRQYPVVIPKGSGASSLLIDEAHKLVAHRGRCSTLNQLREDGFWVVGAHSSIKSHINKCRRCRELRGKLGEQKICRRIVSYRHPPSLIVGPTCLGPFWSRKDGKS